MTCALCEKLKNLKKDQSDFLINEFKHSLLIVGDHQRFPGYCVLIYKNHEKEIHELESNVSHELFDELIISSRAIEKSFNPTKINLSSYGNVVPHIHWHIFPRLNSDPSWPKPPFALMDEFDKYKTSIEQARDVASRVKRFLNK